MPNAARGRAPAKFLPTTPERAALMARVRQAGTRPELAVRVIVRRLGHRFRTNGVGLPGSPDLYDTNRKRVVFVHGCFWHRHKKCAACTSPKNNHVFWQQKFQQNIIRDQRNVRKLRRLGFRVLTVWECQLKSRFKLARLERRLEDFFRNED